MYINDHKTLIIRQSSLSLSPICQGGKCQFRICLLVRQRYDYRCRCFNLIFAKTDPNYNNKSSRREFWCYVKLDYIYLRLTTLCKLYNIVYRFLNNFNVYMKYCHCLQSIQWSIPRNLCLFLLLETEHRSGWIWSELKIREINIQTNN